MASLSLKHINKTYPNGYEAVKDFNLEIEDKEFIIFVGPSGCGKSTTLRMISFLALSFGRRISASCRDRITPSPSTQQSASTKFICGDPINPATNRLFGLSYNTCGVSTCCTIPPFITTILVPSVIASVRWSASACSYGTCDRA